MVCIFLREQSRVIKLKGDSVGCCAASIKNSKSLAAKMCFALRILSSEVYLLLFLYVTVSPSSCLPAAKGSVCLPVEIICGYLKSVITLCVFLTCDHLGPYEDAVI